MFKRNNLKINLKRGSLLAGAFMISMALAISMVALLNSSRTTSKQGESLLSKSHLTHMAEEKLTRDLLSLNNNIELSTSPAIFSWGEAESHLQSVPESVKNFESALYLVITATNTKNQTSSPRHIRLETILEFPHVDPIKPTPKAPPTRPAIVKNAVAKNIEDQLRVLFPSNDEQIDQLKKQILSELEKQFGEHFEDLPEDVETNQYRDPENIEIPKMTKEQEKETFIMSPISLDSPKRNLKIRVWKEVYY